MSYYIHDDGHLTLFDPVHILTRDLRFGEVGVMNLSMKMCGGESIPNTQKKTEAFALIVSELAGHYINLQVIQVHPNTL